MDPSLGKRVTGLRSAVAGNESEPQEKCHFLQLLDQIRLEHRFRRLQHPTLKRILPGSAIIGILEKERVTAQDGKHYISLEAYFHSESAYEGVNPCIDEFWLNLLSSSRKVDGKAIGLLE